MTTVRLQNSFELLQNQFEEFSRNLHLKQSFEIINQSTWNSIFLVQSFFENYEIRHKYLKKEKDKYLFINFEDISEFNQIDQLLFDKISYQYSIQINDLTSLANFIETQDLYLVFATSLNNKNQIRFLLSYSYLLKNRVIFILATDFPQNIFDKQIILNFSDAFLNFYINEKLTNLDLSTDYCLIIQNEIQGDLSKVNNCIKKILKNELQREVSIFDNKIINDIEANTNPNLDNYINKENFQVEIEEVKSFAKIAEKTEQIAQNTFIEESKIIIPKKEITYENKDNKNSKIDELSKTDLSSELNSINSINSIKPNTETINKIDINQNSEEIQKPWFRLFSKKKNIENKEIEKDKYNLTKREQSIYESLIDKKFITRQELAIIAWGEDGKNAKEDAIDQVISRLRRKLVKAGFDKNYIYSKKGEGIGINL